MTRRKIVLPLAVTLAAGSFIAGCASSSGNQGSSGSPGSRSGHARTVLQEIPAALVSADGRHITATGRGGGAVASLALTADENAKRARLSLVEVPAQCPCTANLILQPVTTTLTAPLGDRRLIDADTGNTITTFAGTTLARPDWLPAGFMATPKDSLTPMPGPLGWVRTYSADDPADSNLVTITQYAGNHEAALVPSIGPPTQQVVVNQAVARLWHDGGTDQGYGPQVTGRYVVWQQGGYTFDVGVVLNNAMSANTMLDEATLLRIARGLTLPK